MVHFLFFCFRVLSLSPDCLTTKRAYRAADCLYASHLSRLPRTCFVSYRSTHSCGIAASYSQGLPLDPLAMSLHCCSLKTCEMNTILISTSGLSVWVLMADKIYTTDDNQIDTVPLLVRNPSTQTRRPTQSGSYPSGPKDHSTIPVSPIPKPSP